MIYFVHRKFLGVLKSHDYKEQRFINRCAMKTPHQQPGFFSIDESINKILTRSND